MSCALAYNIICNGKYNTYTVFLVCIEIINNKINIKFK